MKTIEIKFTDSAYQVLRQSVAVRKLSGMAHGTPDDFLFMLLDRLENGVEEYTFKTRKDVVIDVPPQDVGGEG